MRSRRPVRTRRIGLSLLLLATAAVAAVVPERASGNADQHGTPSTSTPGVYELDASARRLTAAEHDYADVATRLPAATAAADHAQLRAQQAHDAYADARNRLDDALADVARATAELHHASARYDDARRAAGRLVRRHYQDGGMALLATVVGAVTPADLATRLHEYHSQAASDARTLQRLERTRTSFDARSAELDQARDRAATWTRRCADAQRTASALGHQAATTEDTRRRLEDQAWQARARIRQEVPAERVRDLTAEREHRQVSALAAHARLPAPVTPAASPGALQRPVDAPVRTGYGQQVHPLLGLSAPNPGVDFAAPPGTPVRAARSGTVLVAGFAPGYGWYVVLAHGRIGGPSLATVYAHLGRSEVRVGQTVPTGAQVGTAGDSGWADGAGVHLEVLVGGDFVNPVTWM